MNDKYLQCARICNTHGLKGDVVIELLCDGIEFIKSVPTVYFGKDEYKPIKIEYIKPYKSHALCKFENCGSIEAVMPLKGGELYVRRDDCVLEEGSHFLVDLIGLTVIDKTSGKTYGKVADVFQNPANDIYEVACTDGVTRLMPGVSEFIDRVDMENKIVYVKPIKGMLSEEEEIGNEI